MMQKFSHITLMVTAIMAVAMLTACSDDSIIYADSTKTEVAEELGYDLQLYIQKDLKSSVRSARPMYSSIPGNNINEVWMRIFKREGSVWRSASDHVHVWAMVADSIYGSEAFEYTSAQGNTFHYLDLTAERDNRLRWHDNNVNISFEDGFRIKLAGLQTESEYLVTATGYNTPMNYAFICDTDDPELEAQWYNNKLTGEGNGQPEIDPDTKEVIYEPETDPETGIIINRVTAVREEELFYGATTLSTDNKGNIQTYQCTNDNTPTSVIGNNGAQVSSVRVEMYRQVAGILGYFKNIPTHVAIYDEHTGTSQDYEVSAVRVVCAARSSRLRMADKDDDRLNNADTPSFQYGYPETVFTIPIPSDAVKGYTDSEGNFVYYKIWHIPARVAGSGYEYSTVRNSVIGSGFWLPVPKQKFVNANGDSFDAVTFQIQLLAKPEKVLRTFNVQLSNGSTSFPVCRDFFYSFGQKLYSGLGSDRSEEEIYYNPEGEEDNPLDLSKQDDIVLTVADAWTESHFFVIGDQQSP